MCVSEARSPGSRLRFVVFVSGVSCHVRCECACAAIGLGRMSSHAHALGLAENPGSVFAHTHMCFQKQGTRGQASGCLIAHAAFVVMFECVTSHRCVLQAHADVCVAEGSTVVTWLRVVSSHTNTHTHAHTRAHLRREQRSHARVSVCTHMCLAKARNPWSHFQFPGLCTDCTHAQPPVSCRSKGLRSRCRKRCFCDVRTVVVAQRCVSGSRNPCGYGLRAQ